MLNLNQNVRLWFLKCLFCIELNNSIFREISIGSNWAVVVVVMIALAFYSIMRLDWSYNWLSPGFRTLCEQSSDFCGWFQLAGTPGLLRITFLQVQIITYTRYVYSLGRCLYQPYSFIYIFIYKGRRFFVRSHMHFVAASKTVTTFFFLSQLERTVLYLVLVGTRWICFSTKAAWRDAAA